MENSKTVLVLYFAHLQEQTGCQKETISLSPKVISVGDLRHFLKIKHAIPNFESSIIHVAVDQQLALETDLLGKAHEVAFFPDVNGG